MRKVLSQNNWGDVITSYVGLVGGLWITLHALPGSPAMRVYVLYGFMAAFTVAVVWVSSTRTGQLERIGLHSAGVGVALSINLWLTLLAILAALDQPNLVPPLHFLVPAVISGLLETVYIYGWLEARLLERFGTGWGLLTTALLYTIYHVGYLGFTSGGLDILGLSFGLYMLVGISNAAVVHYTRSAWSLWPGFIALSTAFDYARINLPLTGYQLGLTPAIVLMLAAVGFLIYRAKPNMSPVAAAAFAPEFQPHGASGRWRRLMLSVCQDRKRRLTVVWTIGMVLLSAGSLSRWIINDPVVLDSFQGQADVIARFVSTRSPFDQMVLNLGLASYLVVPFLMLWAFWDARMADRRLVRQLHLADSSPLFVGRTLGVAAGVLAWMVLSFPFVAAVAWYRGWQPESADLFRYLALTCATVVYAQLSLAVISIITSIVRSTRQVWFTSLLMYIFLFNWWMIYPLFSQYARFQLPASNDPAVIGAWVSSIWRRASQLYGFVPQYQYYMSLAAGYLKNAWDLRFFTGPLAILATYSTTLSLLALSYGKARRRKG